MGILRWVCPVGCYTMNYNRLMPQCSAQCDSLAMEWGRTKPLGVNNGSSLCILQKTQEEKLDSLKYDENDSIFHL